MYDASLCHPPETITTLLIGYTPIQNKRFNNNNNLQDLLLINSCQIGLLIIMTSKTSYPLTLAKYGLPKYSKPFKFTHVKCLWNLSIRILIIHVKPHSHKVVIYDIKFYWINSSMAETHQTWYTVFSSFPYWNVSRNVISYFLAKVIKSRVYLIISLFPAPRHWRHSVHDDLTRWRSQIHLYVLTWRSPRYRWKDKRIRVERWTFSYVNFFF